MVKTLRVEDRIGLVSVEGLTIGGSDADLYQTTIKEIVLAESLTTPGLQTSVTIQSLVYSMPTKYYENFKNKPISFNLSSPKTGSLSVTQQVYRLDNRYMMPVNVGQTEEFTIHACDPTTIEDAKCLVSKSWKCTSPDKVVDYVMNSCLKAKNTDIENATPSRDYIAENIHPLQVIAQQTNVALANGDDPSFVHFMTYRNGGTHHFRSVKKLCQQPAVEYFSHGETGWDSAGYQDPTVALAFMFPCDFDYLSDLLNGWENGKSMNTLVTWNPVMKSMSLLGPDSCDCGIGGYNVKVALTNQGSDKQQDSCALDVENHLLLRQARMGLLEKDKIALRMVVPWNPKLHAGDVINFEWRNKYGGSFIYGTGDYLISSLNHTIRLGGFSTTTMDCVSTTAGMGVA